VNDPGATTPAAEHTPSLPAPKAGPAELALMPPPVAPEEYLSAPQWGMVAYLISDVALFGTLIMAYIALMGRDPPGSPTPAGSLSLPLAIVTTICLLSSSLTIHFAEGSLKKDRHNEFCLWWAATIGLGVVFLAGTAYEWRQLIEEKHLTISRNLFGTTYYTLVGFHAAHVTGGVILMSVVLGLALRRQITHKNHTGVQMVAWYWHFVDVVWIVVFTLVYIVSVYAVK
jgi:cytochrome c oxidase subunit 3/cytochrome o ubiquinol oxidase subunit 3